MTVISEGLLLNILKWVARRRVFKLFSHSHLLYCLPMWFNGYPFKLFDSLNYQIYTSQKVFNKNSLLLWK